MASSFGGGGFQFGAVVPSSSTPANNLNNAANNKTLTLTSTSATASNQAGGLGMAPNLNSAMQQQQQQQQQHNSFMNQTQPANLGIGSGIGIGSTAGTTTTQNSGFNFGSGTGGMFGQNAAATKPNTSMATGFGTLLPPPPQSTASLFSSSTAAAPSSSAPLTLNAGTTSLFGQINQQQTTAPQNLGLGGITSSQAQKTQQGIFPYNNKNKSQEVSLKDQQLPNEIMQSVEEFKKYVKQQKTYCSEICRFSVKEFKKVEEDIDIASNLINEVEKQLNLNRQVAEKLKHDTAKSLQHIEMAQRTFDTPPGLQFDNTAPLQFFLQLTDNFEKEMSFLKTQIENTTKYLKYVGGKNQALTPEDLALGMRRLHETFVALAGRLQSVHGQVEQQKDFYLSLRHVVLHESKIHHQQPNPFEFEQKQDQVAMQQKSVAMQQQQVARQHQQQGPITGPTPFNLLTNPNVAAQHLNLSANAQALNSSSSNINVNPNLFGGLTSGIGSGIGGGGGGGGSLNLTSTGGGSSLLLNFNSPSSGSSVGMMGSTNFQLQKPPVGSKRSK